MEGAFPFITSGGEERTERSTPHQVMPKQTPSVPKESQVSAPVPKRTTKRRRRRKLKANPTSPTVPIVRAIPAGYEDDDRAIRDLLADGLPVTPANIAYYKALDEELKEAELLSSAIARLHVTHQ